MFKTVFFWAQKSLPGHCPWMPSRLCGSTNYRSHKSRAWPADSLKAHSKPRAFRSWRYAARTLANAAFQKCLNCAEQRDKLINPTKQANEISSQTNKFSHVN